MSPRTQALLALLSALALAPLLRLGPPATPVPKPALLSQAPSAPAPSASSISPPSPRTTIATDEVVALRLGTLLRAGDFADALALAETLVATETRRAWFAAIFAAWARAIPADAPALADILRRQAVEPSVFQAFVLGWAESSPAGLADHAITLPAGESRAFALATALDRWILIAPAEAGDWIARLADPNEFDQAAALLVERTDSLHRPTATALAWAENLSDPALRLRALTRVLREWAEHDPAAARHFAESSPTLAPEQRPALLAALRPPVSET